MHLQKINELQKNLKKNNNLEKIGFPKNISPKIHGIPAGKEEMTTILYALWREKKAVEFYDGAAKKTRGIVKDFFEELAKFEKEHVALLEEYVESMINSGELIMG